jgi:hypothetical protein
MTQPYWNTDRELPVAPEPRTCLLCGLEATSATIWLRPAWWREAIDGKWITTIPRCLDIDACRRRVADAGERWLLLEAGEEPGRRRPGVARVEKSLVDPAPPGPLSTNLPGDSGSNISEPKTETDVDYF